MKSILIASLMTLSSFASASIVEGLYKEPTRFYYLAYQNADECAGAGGEWEDDVCWFQGENTIEIKKDEDNFLKVTVSVIGGNGHSCYFDDYVSEEREDRIIAETKTATLTCQVHIDKIYEDSVALNNNGECISFCGARAHLKILQATLAK